MMIRELINYLEEWAPRGAAWERDNVGLMVGTEKSEVKKIFLCLELNPKALDEAIRQKCNLIITHHPFIFRPIKKINYSRDTKSELLRLLIKNDISLYSAHTNLDFTVDGVSYSLARKLGLKNIKFLKNEEANQFKLVVFVPSNKVQSVADAMFEAGAGEIGNYSKCSFSSGGTGTFEGDENSNPAIGKKESFEEVEEIRLEVLVHSWKLNSVIKALLKAHPYEEPAYDIYPLKNKNVNYGYGAIGQLDKSLSRKEFLDLVVKKLNCKNLRYTENKGRIRNVAVCGGAGADLINDAIRANADAFVTADIKYHDFEEANGKILLVDAGHYETEVHILDVLKKRIQNFYKEKNKKIEVIKFRGSTNPVKFYK